MSIEGSAACYRLEQVFGIADENILSERLMFDLTQKSGNDHSTIFTIGRGNNCDFRFDSPDLPYLISRQHAKISLSGEDVFVTDMGSVNGTYLNNVMLQPNAKTRISAGDFITFGCLSLDDAVSPGKVVKQDKAPFRFVLKDIRTFEEIHAQNSVQMAHFDFDKLKDHCDQDSGISNGSPCSSTSSNCEHLQVASKWDESRTSEVQGKLQDDEEKMLPLTVKNLIAFSGCSFKDFQVSSDEKENLSEQNKRTCTVPKVKPQRKRRRTFTFSRKKRRKESEEACAFYECKAKQKRLDGSSSVVSWVQCDNCNKWYHTDCIGCDYDAVRSTKRKFNCGLC